MSTSSIEDIRKDLAVRQRDGNVITGQPSDGIPYVYQVRFTCIRWSVYHLAIYQPTKYSHPLIHAVVVITHCLLMAGGRANVHQREFGEAQKIIFEP